MISSLNDAWQWYESVRILTSHIHRLGRLFWDRDEFAEILARDNRFRYVAATDLTSRAGTVLDDLDDLGVLLLFSVFEATVREQAEVDVERSLPPLPHPALSHAVNELIKEIKTGSFGKVTEAYKGMDANLIEEVNQVRRYRN